MRGSSMGEIRINIMRTSREFVDQYSASPGSCSDHVLHLHIFSFYFFKNIGQVILPVVPFTVNAAPRYRDRKASIIRKNPAT